MFVKRLTNDKHFLPIGLVKELLKRLSNAAGQSTVATSGASAEESAAATTTDTAAAAALAPPPAPVTPKSQTVPEGRSVQSISTTISLLSTLCRGSPSITHVRQLFFPFPFPSVSHESNEVPNKCAFRTLYRICYVRIYVKRWNVH